MTEQYWGDEGVGNGYFNGETDHATILRLLGQAPNNQVTQSETGVPTEPVPNRGTVPDIAGLDILPVLPQSTDVRREITDI